MSFRSVQSKLAFLAIVYTFSFPSSVSSQSLADQHKNYARCTSSDPDFISYPTWTPGYGFCIEGEKVFSVHPGGRSFEGYLGRPYKGKFGNDQLHQYEIEGVSLFEYSCWPINPSSFECEEIPKKEKIGHEMSG